MKLFAISDLHLPAGDNKPMDIFGSHWERHFERICSDWQEKVSADDIVLLSGDLSWAMKLEQAAGDIASVGRLPGRKILIRGNHDYWWSAISRVREALPDGMYAIQNDALKLDGITFCGTRGWIFPSESTDPDDARIYERELKRLKMSLDSAVKMAQGGRIVCILHYPPLLDAARDTDVSALLEEYGVYAAVYGHLHGAALNGAFRGEHRGVRYFCASCDGTAFRLIDII